MSDDVGNREFIIYLWLSCMACGILVLRTGIEPGLLAVTVWSPSHWTSRGLPRSGEFNQSL